MVVVHCPLCCDQPFEDQQALFFHLRGLRNNLYCPICSERFTTLELLINHLSKKCQGPNSPAEAKRRCLSNISSCDNSGDEGKLAFKNNVFVLFVTCAVNVSTAIVDALKQDEEATGPVPRRSGVYETGASGGRFCYMEQATGPDRTPLEIMKVVAGSPTLAAEHV